MKRFFNDLKAQPWAKWLGYTIAFTACAALFPGVIILGYWVLVALLTLMPSAWTLFAVVLVSLAVAVPVIALHIDAAEHIESDFRTSPFKTVAAHAAAFGYEMLAYFMLIVGLSIIPGLTLMAIAMVVGGCAAYAVVGAAQNQVAPKVLNLGQTSVVNGRQAVPSVA